jgi:hypothetical protein
MPGLVTTGPHIIPLATDTQASSATDALIEQMQNSIPTTTARCMLMSSGIMMGPHVECGQPRAHQEIADKRAPRQHRRA